MKKILTILSGLAIVGGASSTVVSCGEKVTASLNDPSYELKLENSEDFKYDVMRWSSDVITTDGYKAKFLAIFQEHNLGWDNGKSALSPLQIVQGQSEIGESTTLISQFLADYQKNSGTGDKTKFISAEELDHQLTYAIYDQNQDSVNPVTVFNKDGIDSKWTDSGNAKLIGQKNETTGVTVIHFKIEITTNYSDFFTGAKANIKGQNLDQYYPGIEKVPTTQNFDYRFPIQFNFNIA